MTYSQVPWSHVGVELADGTELDIARPEGLLVVL